MTRLSLSPWLTPLALLATTLLPSASRHQEQERGELRFIQGERVALQALPAQRGAPQVGELFAGSAVLSHEERGDFARISVQAWVRRDALARQRPEPTATPAESPRGDKVEGLVKAHHVSVAVEEPGGGVLPVRTRLVTRDGRTVHHDEGPLTLSFTLFEERRIAGGRVRGARLASGTVEVQSPETAFDVSVADLEAKTVMITVEVPVSERRSLYGSRTGIALNP